MIRYCYGFRWSWLTFLNGEVAMLYLLIIIELIIQINDVKKDNSKLKVRQDK